MAMSSLTYILGFSVRKYDHDENAMTMYNMYNYGKRMETEI
jgi:hypothetical protein